MKIFLVGFFKSLQSIKKYLYNKKVASCLEDEEKRRKAGYLATPMSR